MNPDNPTTQAQKRILFVERSKTEEQDTSTAFRYICNSLSRHYHLETCFGLDDNTIEIIRAKAGTEEAFDAVITHVPYAFACKFPLPEEEVVCFDRRVQYERAYGRGWKLIKAIKKTNDIPVILYIEEEIQSFIDAWFLEAADCTVLRTHDYKEDCKQLEQSLDYLLKKYQANPYVIEPFKLSKENNQTIVKVQIHLNGGLGFFAGTRIVKECRKYPHAVFISEKNSSDDNKPNAKSIMALLCLGLQEGDEAVVSVEGTDQEAECLAKRLYAILTSRYYFTADLGKIEDSKSTATASIM